MKNKIVYIMINFVLISNTVFSQVDKPIIKGNYLLGGSFSSLYSNETSNFNLNIYPNMGLFIVDGLAIGAIPGFSYSRAKLDNEIINNYTIGIGPFAKYYFNKGAILILSTTYNYSPKNDDWSEISYIKSYVISPGIGYSYFINDKVSLEALLNYNFIFNNTKFNEYIVKKKTKVLALNIGFQLFL